MTGLERIQVQLKRSWTDTTNIFGRLLFLDLLSLKGSYLLEVSSCEGISVLTASEMYSYD